MNRSSDPPQYEEQNGREYPEEHTNSRSSSDNVWPQTFCFISSLRTGCFVCSLCTMNESLLYVIGTISLISSALDDQACVPSSENDPAHDIAMSVRVCNPNQMKTRISKHALYVVFVVLVFMIFSFLMSVLLHYGVLKKRPQLMKPWLACTGFQLGFQISAITRAHMYLVFLIIFKIYFCFIVLAYMKQLKEEQNREFSDQEVGIALERLYSPNTRVVVTATEPSGVAVPFSRNPGKVYAGGPITPPPSYASSQQAFAAATGRGGPSSPKPDNTMTSGLTNVGLPSYDEVVAQNNSAV